MAGNLQRVRWTAALREEVEAALRLRGISSGGSAAPPIDLRLLNGAHGTRAA
jgi:hypothetical protein